MDINRITELANKGDAKAQYELGSLYSEGKVVKQDYNRALAWLNRASEQGLGEASNLIANMYYFGYGVKKDITTAGLWFNKAVSQGFGIDPSTVSVNINNGDLHKVALYALKQAEQGNISAMKLLINIYRKTEPAEASKWLHKVAEQGDAESQNELGIMYYTGQGIRQDSIIALRWFKMAAEQGDAVGQYNLGAMYDHGIGINTDYKQAVYWYRKAAEQRHIGAVASMGVMYYKGLGVERDCLKAESLWKDAASWGDMEAEYCLGVYYMDLYHDYDKANQYFYKAAKKGHEKARKVLSNIGYF